jgi:hypothetical protein
MLCCRRAGVTAYERGLDYIDQVTGRVEVPGGARATVRAAASMR